MVGSYTNTINEGVTEIYIYDLVCRHGKIASTPDLHTAMQMSDATGAEIIERTVPYHK